MDKDTKVLLMAVVIILVALVSFNLSDLTGKATSGASVTVTPGLVTFSKYQTQAPIAIAVNVGKAQVNDNMYLYRVGAKSVETRTNTKVNLCDGIVTSCTQSGLENKGKYQFYLSSALGEGTYRFKIAGSRTANDIVATSNSFRVEPYKG